MKKSILLIAFLFLSINLLFSQVYSFKRAFSDPPKSIVLVSGEMSINETEIIVTTNSYVNVLGVKIISKDPDGTITYKLISNDKGPVIDETLIYFNKKAVIQEGFEKEKEEVASFVYEINNKSNQMQYRYYYYLIPKK